jgi:hypothetical protein
MVLRTLLEAVLGTIGLLKLLAHAASVHRKLADPPRRRQRQVNYAPQALS